MALKRYFGLFLKFILLSQKFVTLRNIFLSKKALKALLHLGSTLFPVFAYAKLIKSDLYHINEASLKHLTRTLWPI